MKTLILSALATAALVSFSACESDRDDNDRDHHHDHRGRTTTTTTEETTTHRPVEATTETRTMRSY